MTIPLKNSVVYGPVTSRRFGSSLGINLLPTGAKFCLSNCLYCQYGWTDRDRMRKSKLRPARELIEDIERDFSTRSSRGDQIDSITFSGNGEPTLHPELGKLIREIKPLRDLYFPEARLAILSDSTRVHLSGVRDALGELDERYMKFDAGDAGTYARINNPVVPIDWEALVRGLKALPEVILQSLFITSPVDNSEGESLDRWLETVREIGPKAVYVYTVSRPPADSRVKPIDRNRLARIARQVKEAAKSPAFVY